MKILLIAGMILLVSEAVTLIYVCLVIDKKSSL